VDLTHICLLEFLRFLRYVTLVLPWSEKLVISGTIGIHNDTNYTIGHMGKPKFESHGNEAIH
jgi:hypothetical protein